MTSHQLYSVLPLLQSMGFSPYVQGAGAPVQPAPATGGALPAQPAVVMPLSAFKAGLPEQGAVAQASAGVGGKAGESELEQLSHSRMFGLVEVGVPPHCVAILTREGVNAGNMADLTWEVLSSIVDGVSGVGRAQLTLLQALHTRLQTARVARSSRSGSRASSRAGSKAGSRSGVGGIGPGSVPPHVAQSVAFGLQQQHGVTGPAPGDPEAQFAAADALAGAAFAGAVPVGLGPGAGEVEQTGSSPWMMKFPGQPEGGRAGGGQCGLAGCSNRGWVRRDGTNSEACCVDHARLMAVARCEARGGVPGSPGIVAPDGRRPLPVGAELLAAGQQEGTPVSPVEYRGSERQGAALCALEGCARQRYRDGSGRLHECCGVTHAMELRERTGGVPRAPGVSAGPALPPQPRGCMMGRTPGPITRPQSQVWLLLNDQSRHILCSRFHTIGFQALILALIQVKWVEAVFQGSMRVPPPTMVYARFNSHF